MLPLLLIVIAGSLVVALGGGATYIWLSRTDGWQFITSHPMALSFGIALSAVFTLANMCLRWFRWTFLLRRFHARVPTRDSFRLFFATAAFITPFYLGELLRGAAIARRHRALQAVVVWVWLVERSSDVAALLVLWGLDSEHRQYLVLGAGLLLLPPWLLGRLTLRLPDADRLHTGQTTSFSIVSVCASISLLAWTLPVLSLWFILGLLDANGSVLLASDVFASGTLIGGISGAPAGLGTTGGAMIRALSEAEIEPAIASASVLALRFGTQWFAVALGAVLVVLWRRNLRHAVRASGAAQQHFDALAPTYGDELPAHYQKQILERKIVAMLPELPVPAPSICGLDLGCGQGWYASELARRGYTMHAIDLSQGQIEAAARHCKECQRQVTLTTYDGVHLPYPDAYFDFAYSINVLHHVPSPDAQRALMSEVLRVLKPEGRFILHEMNVENAIFRAYVSYIFPLLKRIDEGTELWLRPTRLPRIVGGEWRRPIYYFSFAPEFLPETWLRLVKPLERWLETSPLRKYSAHYMATLMHEARPREGM